MKKFCARCGFAVDKTQRIKSRHTGSFYCTDMGECDRRAAGNLSYEEISQLSNRVRDELRLAA